MRHQLVGRAAFMACVGACLISACSGSSSPSSPTSPLVTPIATLSIEEFSATSEIQSTAVVYRVSYRLRETTHRAGVTIKAITYTPANGPGISGILPPLLQIPSGDSFTWTGVTVRDTTNRTAALTLNLAVTFMDDNGRLGIATGTANVTPNTPPPS